MKQTHHGTNKPFPNFRFRTREDALKAMESVKLGKPIDQSLIVWPYKVEGENVVVSQEYIDAEFELSLVEYDYRDNHLVDCK